ncbi:MAG: hypothetical protein GOVbin564_32 [Prokaryotic dsDNA virus sp.]|nr:MAG: hypothetical protein GOVbin564_32 [Prokaryotic dsDNA virus sp.]|tara:strand:- start:1134 stop:1535 length:402 start_codon:yes stop_codon:yes gene_type:complete
MSYTPRRPSIGYIQSTAVTSTTIDDVVFDIPNDMVTTVSSGVTSLTDNAIIIMRMSRDNDGVTNRAMVYYPNTGLSDFKYRGRMPSESNNLFQISEDAFDYANTVEPDRATSAGTGSISFTNYSHCRLWRLNT